MGPQGARCADPFGPPKSLTIGPGDAPWFDDPACVITQGPLPMSTCQFGSAPPTRTVALVGDSHAQAWRGAVHSIAAQLNWEIVEIFKGACPVTHARVLAFDGDVWNADKVADCRHWTDAVDATLTALKPDYVFASGFVSAMRFDANPGRSVETGARGFVDVWTRWADRGMRVVALRDVPTTGGKSSPDCLAVNVGHPLACTRPRAEAVEPDAMTVAAGRISSDRFRLVDLSDEFCDKDRCYAAIGGAVVYFDHDHITGQFARTLAPFLLEAIGGGLN
jgi:hypothetical protein